MPHFLASEISEVAYPAEQESVKFLFEAKEGNEALILCRHKGKEFFLTKVKRAHNYKVGYEKGSRVSPVGIIKESLEAFKKISDSRIISSNLTISCQRQNTCSPYLVTPDFFLQEPFFSAQKILEVGFGSGRMLLDLAKKNRDKIVIGIEIHKPSIEQAIRNIELHGLENLYIIATDARIFVELLKESTLERILVHFPVPWDKKEGRRVISERFIKECDRALRKGGTLEVRTDSPNYYHHCFNEFSKIPKFNLSIYKNREIEITSKYEARWRRQNKDIYDFVFLSESEYEAVEKEGDFTFIAESFSDREALRGIEILRGVEYFVHIHKIYSIDEKRFLVKTVYGAYDMPESLFVLVDGKSAKYVAKKPLHTKINYAAHKALESLLNGSYNRGE